MPAGSVRRGRSSPTATRADARVAMAGDAEARRKAQELIRADSRARWERLAMAAENFWRVLVAIGVAAVALWLIDSMMSREEMWPWLATLYVIWATVWSVFTVAVPILAAAMAAGWIVATAYEGRDKTPGVGFLVRPDRADGDSWIDERMISQALAHLGIAPMERFFKNGGELVYSVPARVDGDGTYAQVRLPMGVTAEDVRAPRARRRGRGVSHQGGQEGPQMRHHARAPHPVTHRDIDSSASARRRRRWVRVSSRATTSPSRTFSLRPTGLRRWRSSLRGVRAGPGRFVGSVIRSGSVEPGKPRSGTREDPDTYPQPPDHPPSGAG